MNILRIQVLEIWYALPERYEDQLKISQNMLIGMNITLTKKKNKKTAFIFEGSFFIIVLFP